MKRKKVEEDIEGRPKMLSAHKQQNKTKSF